MDPGSFPVHFPERDGRPIQLLIGKAGLEHVGPARDAFSRLGGSGAHDLHVLVVEYVSAPQGSWREESVRQGQPAGDGLHR